MFRHHRTEFGDIDPDTLPPVTEAEKAERGFDFLVRVGITPVAPVSPEAIVAEIVDEAPCGRHSNGEVVGDEPTKRPPRFRAAPVLEDGTPTTAEDLRPLVFTMGRA
ncbi:MAG TPA: hypothetical protein VMU09_11175 [Acidimicrobiales bacterium]|nr:hypothetical protein [Acidimicrobiales bacterium]